MRGFTFPYLLLAPDYIESSSGVQVIHQLCHMINEQGGKAWMVNCRVNPEWNTPVINSEDWKVIQNSGQPPGLPFTLKSYRVILFPRPYVFAIC